MTDRLHVKTGDKYNRLTFLSYEGKNSKGHTIWLCRCDCGVEKVMTASRVKKGLVKSCGCFQSERLKELRTIHGMSKTSGAYSSWQLAKRRCHDPKNNRYKEYGARGITMCESWKNSFENFHSDMGPRPKGFSIERKDNNGNYEPDNCIWADKSTQANNRRSNVHLMLYGKRTQLLEVNKILGLDRGSILLRAKRHGISVQQACDHFALKKNIAIVARCKSMFEEAREKLAA